MNLRLSLIVFQLSFVLFAQQPIHNFGGLQLHKKGSLGFHGDLINDGTFDSNLGLIGFYSEEENIVVSGKFIPSFNDLELAVEGSLYLETPIHIDNSVNFIFGNISSRAGSKKIYTQFSENAFYDGALDLSKINGQAAVEGQKVFRFPVGTENNIRPLKIKFIDGPFLAKCAYFEENPNFPQSFSKGFDTSLKDANLVFIHSDEFWNITTTGMIQITLNWDTDSDMNSKVEKIEGITVTGWNKKEGQWFNLGSLEHDGSIDKGWVTSETFNANEYEIFTFGFLLQRNPGSNNYAMSPNGDGANDYFSLKLIDDYPSNKLLIYNSNGKLVYEKSNYKNEFNGKANKNTSQREEVLPEGVYFYILDVKEHNLKYQGYIYLAL
ncbi:MAG: gliding motility-associated C-terminal domain-containing protein [Maribacter sp.]|uniref:gliding motility-associated C-terminal domain-containing protein n=1 Tax=Maribacter sp. TaxID=1897614 RepID=UPI0032986039